MIIVGIDPGAKGYIAGFDTKTNDSFLRPIPYQKNPVDSQFMYKPIKSGICVKTIRSWNLPKKGVLFIENVTPFGMVTNKVASCTACRNYGSLLTIFQMLGFTIYPLEPKIWKKEFELDQEKEKSIRLAGKLFPRFKKITQNDDNAAEALLIAEFGRRFLEND